MDGKYLRLKNLQIGYTFPKTWSRKVGMEKARIYVNGQNLLTFSNNSFIDLNLLSSTLRWVIVAPILVETTRRSVTMVSV